MKKTTETTKAKILVIEDDSRVSKLLETILIREGFDVAIASDGELASNILLSGDEPPDLIILDLSLPYVDGFTFLGRIRNSETWKSSVVIVLSGKTQEEDISKALELGANDYIVKPFQIYELIARVKRSLRDR